MSTATRPPQTADLAQARLLAGLLEAELRELQRALDHRWRVDEAGNEDDPQLPEPLRRHRQQLSEVRRLLAALHSRFPALTDLTGVHTKVS